MSLKDCIRNAAAAGHITKDEAQALEKRYDALVRATFSQGKAREQLIAEIEFEAMEKKRRALLTETTRKAREADLFQHRDEKGQPDPAKALVWMLEHHGQATFMDIEHKSKTILGEWHSDLAALLKEFEKGAISGDKRRHSDSVMSNAATVARLENVVREIMGEKTGDAKAHRLAVSWATVAEQARQRFNGAGGAVGKLTEGDALGYLPQWHNPEAVQNASRDRWIERVSEDFYAVDVDGNRIEGEALRQRLRDSMTWEQITSDGWEKREPSGSMGKGALFRQHQDHRFLHAKSADAWLRYARDFGEGDPFGAMMGYLSTMARDIAFMEQFGPNPEAMFKYLKGVVTRQAARYRPLEIIAHDLLAASRRMSGQNSPFAAVFEKTALELAAIEDEVERLRAKGTKRSKRKLGPLEQRFEATLAALDNVSEAWTAEIDRLTAEARQALGNRVIFNPNGGHPKTQANKAIHRAEMMWEVMRGSANAPVNPQLANALATARNLVSSSTLGAAMLSSLADIASGKVARGFSGMARRGDLAVISGTVDMFKGASRIEAVRAGLILDSAVHAMHQQARYVGSLHASGITGSRADRFWQRSRNGSGFLADRVIALQGLSAWTQASKHSFGMGMLADLADRAEVPFAELPDAVRRMLSRHGITADDWARIGNTAYYEPEPGVKFLRPQEIARYADRDLAEKYHAMVLRETRYAVPEGTVRSLTHMVYGRPGTLVGELSRNFAQFKSYGVAVVMLHGGRIAREIGAGRGASGAGYAGALLLTGMMYGALSLQLKELSWGREPRDMTSEAFWGAAALQSGGLGIYGDFLFSGVNRSGGGLVSTVAGPLVGKFDKLHDFGIGNPLQGAAGERTNVGREAVGLLRDWTPGGSLWYARLAYERVVLDQLQHMIDPEARKAFHRKMQNRKRDFGNDFWWAPGTRSPQRAPNLGAAFGWR